MLDGRRLRGPSPIILILAIVFWKTSALVRRPHLGQSDQFRNESRHLSKNRLPMRNHPMNGPEADAVSQMATRPAA